MGWCIASHAARENSKGHLSKYNSATTSCCRQLYCSLRHSSLLLSQAEVHRQSSHVTGSGSGFRVSMGNGNRYTELLSALRRAPTPCWRKGPSLHPSSSRRARRRESGKAEDSTVYGPASCSQGKPIDRDRPGTPHGQTMGTPANAPIRIPPCKTDDDPLIRLVKAAALSIK